MQIGRTGVFSTLSGQVGLAAVVKINSNSLIGKEVNSGTLIEFQRGEFHTFDSCDRNPNAADVVRKATKVERYSGSEITASQAESAIKLKDFDLGVGVTKTTSAGKMLTAGKSVVNVTGTEVKVSDAVMQAFHKIARALLNKKKASPTQFVSAKATVKSKVNPALIRNRKPMTKTTTKK